MTHQSIKEFKYCLICNDDLKTPERVSSRKASPYCSVGCRNESKKRREKLHILNKKK